jgi:hypothetical protein
VPSVPLVPAKQMSAHFDTVNKHLDLGGVVYGYADFDGDIDYMATRAQGLAQQIAKQVPGMAENAKIDFKPYLKLLGLEDLKAVGFSSVALGDGEYLNRGFLYLPDGRNGIFAVAGGPASPPHFLDFAPADTDIYEEGEINISALASLVKKVWLQTGQKESEQKFEQQLTQNQTGVNARDLIGHLHGHMVAILKFDPDKTITIPAKQPVVVPAFSLILGFEGIGKDVAPALNALPLLDHQDEGGRRFYRSKMGMMIPGVRPAIAIAGTSLFITTDEMLLHQCLDRAAGTGLGSNADFRRLSQELGANANCLTYITPRVYEQIGRISELNPGLDPQVAAALKVVTSMMEGVKHPLLQLTQNQPDGIYYVGRLNHSWKPQLAGLAIYPAIAAISFANAQQKMNGFKGSHPMIPASPDNPNLAVPPAPSAPSADASASPANGRTPDQQVEHNLRILRAAARNYYRSTGKTTANYGDLIGPGKILEKDLEPVEGEDYQAMKFEEGKPVAVTLPDGRTLMAPVPHADRAP